MKIELLKCVFVGLTLVGVCSCKTVAPTSDRLIVPPPIQNNNMPKPWMDSVNDVASSVDEEVAPSSLPHEKPPPVFVIDDKPDNLTALGLKQSKK